MTQKLEDEWLMCSAICAEMSDSLVNLGTRFQVELQRSQRSVDPTLSVPESESESALTSLSILCKIKSRAILVGVARASCATDLSEDSE